MHTYHTIELMILNWVWNNGKAHAHRPNDHRKTNTK